MAETKASAKQFESTDGPDADASEEDEADDANDLETDTPEELVDDDQNGAGKDQTQTVETVTAEPVNQNPSSTKTMVQHLGKP